MRKTLILALFLVSACHHKQPHHAALLVDVNHATVAELKALPGVGDALAGKIVAGRPYDEKNQLVSRGVVPQAAYDKMSSEIIARH